MLAWPQYLEQDASHEAHILEKQESGYINYSIFKELEYCMVL